MGVIGMVLYSNFFQKWDAADNSKEEAEEHECLENFEKIYKSMED